jgi:nucleotide-binding universal stress UspA family protein
MSIAKILVPVRGDGKGENVLSHAAVIARAHNAHIEAVHCRARPQDMIPHGVALPASLRKQMEDQAVELANAEEANLQGLFRALMEKLGLEVVESGVPPLDRPTCGWVEEQGKQMDVIKSHGRLADLVAVAKPDRDRNLGVNSLKAALFHTGRPVLVCPPKPAPAKLGERIAIAWNGSSQAARAVALALPLIQAAKEVIVLDGGAKDHGASGEELLRYMAIRGVKARREPIHADDDPGATILAAAVGVAGADLLVMGAYSHSREHESVFGGATQHVVDYATMPVVMVH